MGDIPNNIITMLQQPPCRIILAEEQTFSTGLMVNYLS